jgi:hypothetical protein
LSAGARSANLYDMVEWKRGKVIHRDPNKMESLQMKDYKKYKAVHAKITTIIFKFVPI